MNTAPTTRPLLGEIVEIPAHIATPTTYVPQRRCEHRVRIGRIVEVGVGIVAVAFFGYPHTWDYKMSDVAHFSFSSEPSNPAVDYEETAD